MIVPFAILLPVSVYFLFFANDPVLDPEVDILLGRQAVNAALLNTIDYPVMMPSADSSSYQRLNQIVDEITKENPLKYKDLFKYDSIIIIQNDELVKVSCYPGGYLFVYTGAIKAGKSDDLLAGMIAHEIAHAEQRHVALALQKEFGQKTILKFAVLATGTAATAVGSKIIRVLTQLNYSRTQEIEADSLSVTYLANTGFPCNGVAHFIQEWNNESENIPEFLREYPDSEIRMRKIESVVRRLDCDSSER